jgi:hypothetical protein
MSSKAHQYTVRSVPASVDRALRRKAAARGVSLNTLILEALEAEAGTSATPRQHHDLDTFIGSWVADAKVDRALAEQRRVDPIDWEERE